MQSGTEETPLAQAYSESSAAKDLPITRTLLSERFAAALGAQRVVPATLRSTRARAAGHNPRLGQMEFVWPLKVHGQQRVAVWHPLQFQPAPLTTEIEPPHATWVNRLADALRALTVDDTLARTLLALHPRGPTPPSRPAGIHEGTFMALDGTMCVVLSNDSFHRQVGAAVALLAPVAPLDAASRSRFAISHADLRVCWEHASVSGTSTLARLLPMSSLTPLPSELLRSAREHFLNLLLQSFDTNVESAVLTYLIDSRRNSAFEAWSMIGSNKLAYEEPWSPDHAIDSHSDLRPAGRMFTRSAANVGGESYIPLGLASELFDLWLHQVEDRVDLLIEPADLDGHFVRNAWVEAVSDVVTTALMPDGVNHAGIARIPLGRLQPRVPLSFVVGVESPLGVEEFSVHHAWRVAG